MAEPVNAKFLADPAEIRQAIHSLTTKAKSLDLAVAFVGPEWQRLLANYSGPLRTVCWLAHPATDPDAVQSMMKRTGANVKQRNGLHAKVYIAPGVGAVVGSANLSQPALTDRTDAHQCEAAVLVSDVQLVDVVSKWFERLWKDKAQTKTITDIDLQRAKKDRKKWPFRWPHTINPVPAPPDPLPPLMRRLAKQVENISLEKELGEDHKFVCSLVPPSLSTADVTLLVDRLGTWTKHRAAFKNFEKQSLTRTREGLSLLLDEGIDTYERLKQIGQKRLLKGLRIPSLSLLLYWWRPNDYPPFDAKTRAFLKGFKISNRGMSDSSPACYATWLQYAEILRAKLHLPSVGHVDRVVSAYYTEFVRAK